MSARLDIVAACGGETPDGRTLELGPIAALDCAILGDAFARIDPWARYPYPASELQSYFAGSTAESPRYAIRLNGAVAGAIGLKLDWLRGPYLQFLGLLPAFQNCGAGGVILRALDQAARASSIQNVWVCASDFNQGAIAFYERHGYRPVAQLPGLVRDGRTEVLLRKIIPRA